MFHKVLIANRGEIAVRVIRACRELNLTTVAIYSEADRESLHVRLADESVCIGPPSSQESYLAIPRVLSAAEITGADAIHPGYGFLSENHQFADACESSGIVFLGPSAESIRIMGDKSEAKAAMIAAGVPVIPGNKGVLESSKNALEMAEEIGYPIILKARDGGGGKGMRVVTAADELVRQYELAQTEAQAAFGSGALYLEKLLEHPRHVEIQIVADAHGNVIHLHERDCSIQRRHQKLLEEAPCAVLDPEIRRAMGEVACRGAREIDYRGVGTMEFLYQDGAFYFMEMNTRLQVEHPVTEMITGVDLVKLQIRAGAGEPLGLQQSDITVTGHSLECRINAESPYQGFRPCPGQITRFHQPGGPGVRVDTHIYSGYTIPPYYDSMIAKVITHGRDREEAIARMARALGEMEIEGIDTTIPYHREILAHPEFLAGRIDTRFVERNRAGNGKATGLDQAELR
jgi:acetyl-CoA carboxylase biotin carboxylase subunit